MLSDMRLLAGYCQASQHAQYEITNNVAFVSDYQGRWSHETIKQYKPHTGEISGGLTQFSDAQIMSLQFVLSGYVYQLLG